MAENITIDQLAGMIKSEFDNIGGKFDKIDDRFDKIDNRFDKIDTDIKELKEGHERLDLRMSNVAYRFEVDDLKNQLNLLRQRVDSLENK